MVDHFAPPPGAPPMPTGAPRPHALPLLVATAPAALSGMRWELHGRSLVIGRAGDIALPVRDVSGRHAAVERCTDGVWISDLDSTNGVLLNGAPLTPGVRTRLGHGDTLALGSVRLAYLDPAAGPGAGVPVRESDSRSQTTRCLSAATQLDARFAALVVDRIVDQPFRALSPAYGVDLAVVTRWAVATLRRRAARDAVLLVVLLWSAAALLIGLHRQDLTALAEARDARGILEQVAGRWPVLCTALVAALLACATERWITDYFVLERRMTRDRFKAADAPEPHTRRVRDRLTVVAARPHGNLMVFATYYPFAGSGLLVDEWSFAIDIQQGATGGDGVRKKPKPFEAADLHTALIQALRELGIPDLRVDERLFVSGYDVRGDTRLLPDRFEPPVTSIGPEVIRGRPTGPGAPSRAYVCVEVPAWGGQLVVTLFVRAVRTHGSLFLESIAFTLPPLLGRYQAVDTLRLRSGAGALADAVVAASARTLPDLLSSPVATARHVRRRYRAHRRRRGQKRYIRHGYPFDYGALPSIREEAAGEDRVRYFLELDEIMVVKVVQERVLKSVADFLAAHDVDLAEFASHQTTINNSTVNNNNDNRIRFGNINGSGNRVGHEMRGGAGGAPPSRQPQG
ncbi:FHA domain-containing protein [Streptomyces cinnamoneus]|uniref:FHA domain-containing protein n=1 Tax=Streptomyces cinnamoneus TaxID=53446 RepID=UPI0033D276BE